MAPDRGSDPHTRLTLHALWEAKAKAAQRLFGFLNSAPDLARAGWPDGKKGAEGLSASAILGEALRAAASLSLPSVVRVVGAEAREPGARAQTEPGRGAGAPRSPSPARALTNTAVPLKPARRKEPGVSDIICPEKAITECCKEKMHERNRDWECFSVTDTEEKLSVCDRSTQFQNKRNQPRTQAAAP
ncbi:unnamed protein product [Caretta caretta]